MFAFSALRHINASVPHGSVTLGVAALDLSWCELSEHSNIQCFFDLDAEKQLSNHFKSICDRVFFSTTRRQLLCCRLYKATNVNWHHCVPKTGLEKLGFAVTGGSVGVIKNIRSTCQRSIWVGKHIPGCMHWTYFFFVRAIDLRHGPFVDPLAIAGVPSFRFHFGSWWSVLEHVG